MPDTIALAETAPAAARNPSFLERNNMEVIDAKGRVMPSEDLPWGDEKALASYRFRQRPGASNALGFVKFLFPNEHAVYVHDTPADTLFAAWAARSAMAACGSKNRKRWRAMFFGTAGVDG